MKYLTYLTVSAFMLTCLACGHRRPVDESELTGTTQPITPANTTMQPQTIPVNLNSQTTTSTTVVPTNTTVAPGMNPPHGQPGHRCDIAVGAPLNSAPAPQFPTNNVTAPLTIPTNQPAATTAVAPGMNPPHGQPGHRCDIAVGAPLNSKPASNAATPVNISSDQPQPATTTVAPGMNPPHGQPGHRCDIAVGAPLDSKPILVAGTPSTNTVTSSQSIPSIVPVKPLPDSSKQKR